jgi:hypothetical protein
MGEAEAKAAFTLKALTTLEMLAGQQVDWTISFALRKHARTGGPIEGLSDLAVSNFERLLEASRMVAPELKAGQRAPDNVVVLLEDYYELQVSPTRIQDLVQRISTCMKNFQESEVLYRILRAGSRNWIDVKQPLARSPSILIDGTIVYTNYDFLFKEDDQLHIIDWKSGRPSSKDQSQLVVYALYAESHGYKLDRVDAQAVYLLIEPVAWQPRSFTPADCASAREFIVDQVQEELSVSSLRRAADDTPLYWIDRDQLPPTPEIRKCTTCNFRAICPEGQLLFESGHSSASS